MNMLLNEMRDMNFGMNTQMQDMKVDLNTNFQTLQQQISKQADIFSAEVAKLRTEMVSQERFEQLEAEVQILKSGGLPQAEVSSM